MSLGAGSTPTCLSAACPLQPPRTVLRCRTPGLAPRLAPLRGLDGPCTPPGRSYRGIVDFCIDAGQCELVRSWLPVIVCVFSARLCTLLRIQHNSVSIDKARGRDRAGGSANLSASAPITRMATKSGETDRPHTVLSLRRSLW